MKAKVKEVIEEALNHIKAKLGLASKIVAEEGGWRNEIPRRSYGGKAVFEEQ